MSTAAQQTATRRLILDSRDATQAGTTSRPRLATNLAPSRCRSFPTLLSWAPRWSRAASLVTSDLRITGLRQRRRSTVLTPLRGSKGCPEYWERRFARRRARPRTPCRPLLVRPRADSARPPTGLRMEQSIGHRGWRPALQRLAGFPMDAWVDASSPIRAACQRPGYTHRQRLRTNSATLMATASRVSPMSRPVRHA
jgi:hypothetical protein